MDKKIKLISSEIQAANKILITSHKRPDGDAVGSVLGLGLALQEIGKEVQMVLVDGVPKNFQHLDGSDQICKRASDDFDISIILDCSDLKRVGINFEDDFIPTINIDHHVTNQEFAQINIVDLTAPATAEILKEIILSMDLPISLSVADALLTGLITDTLGFRTCNIHPKTLRIAADLMDVGCDLPALYQNALLNRSYEAIRYWGAGISTLQFEDRLLWATLSQEDRCTVGYPGRDDADLINVLSSINDVDIAIIFVEQPYESVKVSWRAKRGLDVSQIASSFGGGGHKPAAGADIQGEIEFIKKDVINATRKYLMTRQL
jgi:phosphoesterase RecJ-like protein